MTKDDILRIAREAGFVLASNATGEAVGRFSRFAALVAAAEREACLQIADYCADADMPASMAANAIRARSTQ